MNVTAIWLRGMFVIKSMQPVFVTRRGRLEGPISGVPSNSPHTIVAVPGHAVGTMYVRGTERVNGLELCFHRITPNGLPPQYEYRWGHGDPNVRPLELNKEGRPIIGVFGRRGADLDAIGFVYGPK